jgi:hypothetical protein
MEGMKRTLAVFLAIATGAGIVAACVGDDPSPGPAATTDGGPINPPGPVPPPGTDGSATDAGNDSGAGVYTVVAKDQEFPIAIAVLGNVVYWANEGGNTNGCTDTADGTVMSAPSDGSAAPKTIATGLQCPGHIAVTGDKVYWTERGTPSLNQTDGKIVSAGHGGESPQDLVSGIQLPLYIHVDGTSLFYFIGPPSGQDAIWRIPVTGGPSVRLTVTGASAAGMAIQSNLLYWAEDLAGRVYQIPENDDGGADGGTKQKLADDAKIPSQPLLLGGAVYWLDKSATCSISKWTQATGRTDLVADLGVPRELPTQKNSGCRQFATDGQYFYVTTFTDKLVRVPVAGGAVERLDVSFTTAIAVGDDGSVYVGTGASGASIVKLVK